MKILQICSAREIGGGELHLVDLIKSLTERDHTVYAALIPNSPLIGKLDFLPKNQILQLRMRNSLDLSGVLKLARFIKTEGIEIIHAHVGRDYTLAAAASWRAGKKPFVLTRHVLFPLKRIRYKLLLRRASRVIAVSKSVASALQKQNLFKPDKIITIQNGINLKRFIKNAPGDNSPSELVKDTRQLLVGMIGHIAPIKGQEDFIRAAAIIAAHRNDVDFVVVGEDKSHTGEIARRSKV